MKRTALQAGIAYLTVVLSGIFSLLYVPSRIIDWQHPQKTYEALLDHESLFRTGIAAGIVCYIAFLILPLLLYQLLHGVHKTMATAMVALSVVSVPVSLYNLLHKWNVLVMVHDTPWKQAMPGPELFEKIMWQLEFYDNGIALASVFWGLWLFPFGYLVYHSNAMPKLLGVLLMAGCFSYLITTFGNLLNPAFKSIPGIKYLMLPASAGEIGTALWLLWMGLRPEKATVQKI